MRLQAALSGELDQILADEVRIAEQAVTLSIREATDGLKTELRSQITGAGLGQRLANTWRGEVYPKGPVWRQPWSVAMDSIQPQARCDEYHLAHNTAAALGRRLWSHAARGCAAH